MNSPSLTVGVSEKRRAAMQEFVRAEGLPWALVDAPGGRLNLVERDDPAQCDLTRLFPGGRILCSTALEMAQVYAAPPASIGRLMNLLEIRIGECQLGCFR